MRTKTNGNAAAIASSAQAITAAARNSGGSHSQSPSHDSARNTPTAVKSEVSAGHSRSHKIVQRARCSVTASAARVASAGRGSGAGWGNAVSVTTDLSFATRHLGLCTPQFTHDNRVT